MNKRTKTNPKKEAEKVRKWRKTMKKKSELVIEYRKEKGN